MPASIQPAAIDDSFEYTPQYLWTRSPYQVEYQDQVVPGDTRSAIDDRCATEYGLIPDRPFRAFRASTSESGLHPVVSRKPADIVEAVTKATETSKMNKEQKTIDSAKAEPKRKAKHRYKAIVIRSKDGEREVRRNPWLILSGGKADTAPAAAPLPPSHQSVTPEETPARAPLHMDSKRQKIRIVSKDGQTKHYSIPFPMAFGRSKSVLPDASIEANFDEKEPEYQGIPFSQTVKSKHAGVTPEEVKETPRAQKWQKEFVDDGAKNSPAAINRGEELNVLAAIEKEEETNPPGTMNKKDIMQPEAATTKKERKAAAKAFRKQNNHGKQQKLVAQPPTLELEISPEDSISVRMSGARPPPEPLSNRVTKPISQKATKTLQRKSTHDSAIEIEATKNSMSKYSPADQPSPARKSCSTSRLRQEACTAASRDQEPETPISTSRPQEQDWARSSQDSVSSVVEADNNKRTQSQGSRGGPKVFSKTPIAHPAIELAKSPFKSSSTTTPNRPKPHSSLDRISQPAMSIKSAAASSICRSRSASESVDPLTDDWRLRSITQNWDNSAAPSSKPSHPSSLTSRLPPSKPSESMEDSRSRSPSYPSWHVPMASAMESELHSTCVRRASPPDVVLECELGHSHHPASVCLAVPNNACHRLVPSHIGAPQSPISVPTNLNDIAETGLWDRSIYIAVPATKDRANPQSSAATIRDTDAGWESTPSNGSAARRDELSSNTPSAQAYSNAEPHSSRSVQSPKSVPPYPVPPSDNGGNLGMPAARPRPSLERLLPVIWCAPAQLVTLEERQDDRVMIPSSTASDSHSQSSPRDLSLISSGEVHSHSLTRAKHSRHVRIQVSNGAVSSGAPQTGQYENFLGDNNSSRHTSDTYQSVPQLSRPELSSPNHASSNTGLKSKRPSSSPGGTHPTPPFVDWELEISRYGVASGSNNSEFSSEHSRAIAACGGSSFTDRPKRDMVYNSRPAMTLNEWDPITHSSLPVISRSSDISVEQIGNTGFAMPGHVTPHPLSAVSESTPFVEHPQVEPWWMARDTPVLGSQASFNTSLHSHEPPTVAASTGSEGSGLRAMSSLPNATREVYAAASGVYQESCGTYMHPTVEDAESTSSLKTSVDSSVYCIDYGRGAYLINPSQSVGSALQRSHSDLPIESRAQSSVPARSSPLIQNASSVPYAHPADTSTAYTQRRLRPRMRAGTSSARFTSPHREQYYNIEGATPTRAASLALGADAFHREMVSREREYKQIRDYGSVQTSNGTSRNA